MAPRFPLTRKVALIPMASRVVIGTQQPHGWCLEPQSPQLATSGPRVPSASDSFVLNITPRYQLHNSRSSNNPSSAPHFSPPRPLSPQSRHSLVSNYFLSPSRPRRYLRFSLRVKQLDHNEQWRNRSSQPVPLAFDMRSGGVSGNSSEVRDR